MKMNEIKAIARERGINAGRLCKVDLVRTLQQEEGNARCFQTGIAAACDQEQCLWRADCS